MTKSLTALALAALATLPAHAAVSLTASSLTYSESFDTLSTVAATNLPWANDSTLAGWSLFNRANGTAATVYRTDTGASSQGYFYSYGKSGSVERALGSLGSGTPASYWGTVASDAVAGYIALALQNNTGKIIDSFTLAYTGEQWRDGGKGSSAAVAAQSMTVQYGFGSSFASITTWSDISSLTFISPTFTNLSSGAALDGNAAANSSALTGSVASLNWKADETLWVRWVERNNAGNDHGLAIDNVAFSATTVSAVPEPQTYALMLGGLGLMGWMARRRKTV